MAQPTTDPSLGLLCQRSMRRAFLSKMARRAGDGEDTSSRESGLGKGHVLISAGRVGGQDKPQFLSSGSFVLQTLMCSATVGSVTRPLNEVSVRCWETDRWKFRKGENL